MSISVRLSLFSELCVKVTLAINRFIFNDNTRIHYTILLHYNIVMISSASYSLILISYISRDLAGIYEVVYCLLFLYARNVTDTHESTELYLLLNDWANLITFFLVS